MGKFYYDKEKETAARDLIEAIQLQKLEGMLSKVYRDNMFYRKKFKQHGVTPENIKSLRDLNKLPFSKKTDFQEDQQNDIYGTNLSEPLQNYTQYHQTTGTTGKPLKWLDTRESWDWRARCIAHAYRAAGIDARDTLFLPFNFGPYSAFWGSYEAAQHLGLLTIVAGGWNSEQRLKCLIDNQATVLVTTPTYAQLLLEKAKEHKIDLGASRIRAIILTGEPGAMIPGIRERIETGWQAKVFEYSGLTEVGTYAFQCSRDPQSIHVIESEFIVEVVNPDTGEQLGKGETGELVLTNLGRSCSPAIRFRTGDLVKLKHGACSCGRTFAQLEGGVLGRRDEMLVVRGVNIFPGSIRNTVEKFLVIGENYQIAVYKENNVDELCIKIETAREELVNTLGQEIKSFFNLRVNVQQVPAGTLPKFDYKAKRFVDERYKIINVL